MCVVCVCVVLRVVCVCCVFCACVCVCVCVSSEPSSARPPSAGPPAPDLPPPDRPNFRALFLLLLPFSHLFSLSGGLLVFFSLWGSSRGIVVVFWRPAPSNVHVWALGLSCDAPAAWGPPASGRGFRRLESKDTALTPLGPHPSKPPAPKKKENWPKSNLA